MLRQTTLPIKKYADPIDYSDLSMHCAWLGRRERPSSITELKELLMTLVVDRKLQSGSLKLHVLIVVVGGYDTSALKPLQNSHLLGDDLVGMWESGDAVPSNGMELQTIELLLSSPNYTNASVELPTAENCENAFKRWADRIKAEKGVGVVHWVGHGYCLSNDSDGPGVTLLCSDLMPDTLDGVNLPSGHSWSQTLEFISSRAGDRPLFCFIDSCRKLLPRGAVYRGFGSGYYKVPAKDVQTYYSCSGDESAFWIQPNDKDTPPAFPGGAVGTRAFMAALTGFGAFINNVHAPRFDTRPQEVVEAVNWLSRMWLDHYEVDDTVEADCVGGKTDARVTSTERPQSVIKVTSDPKVSPPSSADARRLADTTDIPSHCSAEPYWFTIQREDHSYRVARSSTWNGPHNFRQPSGEVEVTV